MTSEMLIDASEKSSVTWISDMIALVYKKDLMWDDLELELDNLSFSSFTSKQIIKLLLHKLKTLHNSQCKCSNNDDSAHLQQGFSDL